MKKFTTKQLEQLLAERLAMLKEMGVVLLGAKDLPLPEPEPETATEQQMSEQRTREASANVETLESESQPSAHGELVSFEPRRHLLRDFIHPDDLCSGIGGTPTVPEADRPRYRAFWELQPLRRRDSGTWGRLLTFLRPEED